MIKKYILYNMFLFADKF